MKKTIEIINVDGCIIRDDSGFVVAELHEVDGRVSVNKTSACTIGTYLYILTYLKELGFELYAE